MLAKVDDRDPKAAFKKLAVIKKYTMKQRAGEQKIEKVTKLAAKGDQV